MILPSYQTGNRAGPALLFLHGFMGDHRDWEGIIQLLQDHFLCISLDLPGHGAAAQLPGNWDMPSTAAAVCRTVDRLALAKPVVAGYSMGGRLALFLALRYPQRFAGGIIESASPGLRRIEERIARIAHDAAMARQLLETEFHSFLNKWYEQPVFAGFRDHAAFADVIARRCQQKPAALARVLQEMGTGRQPSLWKELAGNKIPLLLVVGEKDVKFNAIAEMMCQESRHMSREVFADCGHNCHVEQPQTYAGILRDYVERWHNDTASKK